MALFFLNVIKLHNAFRLKWFGDAIMRGCFVSQYVFLKKMCLKLSGIKINILTFNGMAIHSIRLR